MMNLAIEEQNVVNPVDALWTLFVGQPQKVREEFIELIKRFVSNTNETEHGKMTYSDIQNRLQQVEEDIMRGNVMAAEDVHRNIAGKCPWL